MKLQLSLVLASLAALGPTTLCLQAQDSPAQATPARDGALNDASLKQMLIGLGYEPKALSKGFLITVKRDEWTYYVQLVLSPDQTKLGFNANLGKVPQPETIPGAAWQKLLEDNIDVDPSSFNFDPKLKKLYMHRVLDNRFLTPGTLRQQLDNFCENIHSTSGDWKFVQ